MEVESTKELTSLSAQALKELLDTLIQAKSFVIEQAPSIAQEMLRWAVISAVGELAFLVFMVSLLVYTGHKASQVRTEFLANALMIFTILGGSFTIFFAVGTLIDVCVAAQAIWAPKLYLIEHVSKLIKGL